MGGLNQPSARLVPRLFLLPGEQGRFPIGQQTLQDAVLHHRPTLTGHALVVPTPGVQTVLQVGVGFQVDLVRAIALVTHHLRAHKGAAREIDLVPGDAIRFRGVPHRFVDLQGQLAAPQDHGAFALGAFGCGAQSHRLLPHARGGPGQVHTLDVLPTPGQKLSPVGGVATGFHVALVRGDGGHVPAHPHQNLVQFGPIGGGLPLFFPAQAQHGLPHHHFGAQVGLGLGGPQEVDFLRQGDLEGIDFKGRLIFPGVALLGGQEPGAGYAPHSDPGRL